MKVKGVITITGTESKRRKAALASKLRELLDTSREREELRIEYLADPTDQVRSNTDREMTVQRLDHQARLIHDVQSALGKIDEGVYGLCERCDEPIPCMRLDAVPWARLCVPCQSEVENAERDRRPTLADAA